MNSDILVTAGALVENRVIEATWFKEGALACLVDFDVMWKHKTLDLVDKYYFDDLIQFKCFKDNGFFIGVKSTPKELKTIINGEIEAIDSSKDRIYS